MPAPSALTQPAADGEMKVRAGSRAAPRRHCDALPQPVAAAPRQPCARSRRRGFVLRPRRPLLPLLNPPPPRAPAAGGLHPGCARGGEPRGGDGGSGDAPGAAARGRQGGGRGAAGGGGAVVMTRDGMYRRPAPPAPAPRLTAAPQRRKEQLCKNYQQEQQARLYSVLHELQWQPHRLPAAAAATTAAAVAAPRPLRPTPARSVPAAALPASAAAAARGIGSSSASSSRRTSSSAPAAAAAAAAAGSAAAALGALALGGGLLLLLLLPPPLRFELVAGVKSRPKENEDYLRMNKQGLLQEFTHTRVTHSRGAGQERAAGGILM